VITAAGVVNWPLLIRFTRAILIFLLLLLLLLLLWSNYYYLNLESVVGDDKRKQNDSAEADERF